ncbi:retrovirus-related pol polyprotein from transposon TNT 1-94 [Tanacetum coccineum]
MSAEQAFWLKHSSLSETPVTSHTPVRIEAPSELPKVSLVNESLKKLKYQLANFDKVVKKRLTSDAITAGSWGFEHTKECFLTEIIPFLKVLKDTFNAFDKTLLDEITEVQTVFNQMEAAVDQCSVDKNVFEIQIKQLRIDNDQLLNQIMSQEIVHIVANSVDICDVKKSCVNDCRTCPELEIEIFKKKDFVEKETYDKLVKSYSNLEKHCISLELATQLNQEIFQRENSGENLNAPTFNQLFEINELKAQSQEKDTVIRKLKERIKYLSRKDSAENVKKDIDEIETINIELEHSVAKLLSENENLRKERVHLKSIFKDQFDSVVKTRVQSKEHCDSLIAQINAKSVENSDLNAQLQEKVFAITTSKNELRKLKGKNVVNTAVSKPNATLAPRIHALILQNLVRRVKPTTSASGSKPTGNTKKNKITRPPHSNHKNKVGDHPRKVKSSLNKTNSVSEPISNALVKHSVRNVKFESICAICNKCLFDANHDMCLIDFVNDVNWKPTGRFFTIVGNSCLLTRITPKKIVHLKETTPKSVDTPKPDIKVYSRRPKQLKSIGCPDRPLVSGLRMFKTHDRELLSAHELRIRHNLFYVGQFCDTNLEVAFRKNTCFIQNLEGVDLLSGSRDTNLYTISLDDMLKTSPIRLLSKASNTKSWLWHRRLSHPNFDTLNKLAKDGLARGKSKKSSHQPKAKDTNQEKLYLLHMDLYGPMRVESINRKKYILAEAINTTCYTQNRSLIRLRYNKTPYELMHDKKHDLSFFHVFGSLCYPTNDSEELGKLNVKADIGIFVGYSPTKKAFRIYNRRTLKIIETINVTFDELTTIASEQFGSGPGLQVMTPATCSSGLVPNCIPQQPCNPPKRNDWDTLFQPLFDEYFNPPTISVSTVPIAAAPKAVEIADSPVSTSIEQDAPSSSIPSTQDQEHSLIISQRVEESPKTPLFHDDPLHEPLHEDSTS